MIMEEVLLKYFGIEASRIKKLAGYENVNYLVLSGNSKYILKTYPFSQRLYDLLLAESELLEKLEDQHKYPVPLRTKSGTFLEAIENEGDRMIVRLLTFLEGEFLAQCSHTPELLKSLGTFLAALDKKLLELDHYTIQARKFEWDLQYLYLNEPFVQDIAKPQDRKLVQYFMQQFRELVQPEIPKLKKSIIHNDANDWNVLVQQGKVAGIIDFGDITYGPLINELTVAITYVMMDKEDPIKWACYVLQAYHQVIPLTILEADLLYYLVAGRLCISVCNSAHSKKLDPSNAYTTVSEESAWKLLKLWIQINPLYANNQFRNAIGQPALSAESVRTKIRRRNEHISRIVSISYAKPIYMERAAFQYMYDGYGNTFLDAYNNIPHVGHAHPRVVEAGQRQMAKLNTNTRYVYDLLEEYAHKLLSRFPAPLNKVFFVNSGSAASDLAMRLSRHYTGCDNIMVMEHGYHGHTMTGIEISDYKFSNKKGPGQKPWILRTPIPDTFWGRYREDEAGQKYASDASQQILDFGAPIAAFISEPIVGCGGQVPLAPGYLKHLYPAIRAQGGVCISDEVQTGFGRLGEYFWGFEAQEVVPDIVVLGKPMGNGHPMGAVITTDEIARSFEEGVEFFSSFGGNPVSCAIGLEVLNVIEEENLQHHAWEVGEYYKKLIWELANDFDCIGDVRGSGLFLGFEIVDEHGQQDTDLAAKIKNELRNRHILISTDGPYDNVLKSKPPLCFSRENAEQVVENIRQILKMIKT
jgi:4-aminobutyrate aminotransferase-like enzyme/Ser/Thr protein kinase RdoA (MazF antagonist)